MVRIHGSKSSISDEVVVVDLDQGTKKTIMVSGEIEGRCQAAFNVMWPIRNGRPNGENSSGRIAVIKNVSRRRNQGPVRPLFTSVAFSPRSPTGTSSRLADHLR